MLDDVEAVSVNKRQKLIVLLSLFRFWGNKILKKCSETYKFAIVQ